MFLVAIWANRINPTATIQLTTIELVMGKLKGRAISTDLVDRPCSVGALGWVPAVNADGTGVTGDLTVADQVEIALMVMNAATKKRVTMAVFSLIGDCPRFEVKRGTMPDPGMSVIDVWMSITPAEAKRVA
jgi:hypothetical protein